MFIGDGYEGIIDDLRTLSRETDVNIKTGRSQAHIFPRVSGAGRMVVWIFASSKLDG